jgi:phage protein U
MLYQLGRLQVRVHPFNVERVTTSSATDYAVKPVVGREQPLEAVGEGANVKTLSGTLFPKVLRGLDELELLHQMRQSNMPQFLMRGDGKALGWWAITSVNERETYLDADGIGRKNVVTIRMRRAGKPRDTSLFSILRGLLQ